MSSTAQAFELLRGYKGTSLDEKTVILIFSAEWHIYFCTNLLPKLENVYSQVKGPQDAEFLYVSCDRSKEEFERFSKKLPWPSIPYDDPLRKQLIDSFVPPSNKPSQPVIVSLALKKDNTKVLCSNALGRLKSEASDGVQDFPWEGSAAETGCTICATLFMCTIQ